MNVQAERQADDKDQKELVRRSLIYCRQCICCIPQPETMKSWWQNKSTERVTDMQYISCIFSEDDEWNFGCTFLRTILTWPNVWISQSIMWYHYIIVAV